MFINVKEENMHRHSEAEPKNPEKNIFKVWILRFAFAPLRMTIHILTLAAVLCLGTISESRAACGTTASAVGTDDDGNYCGICNDSGTCKWKLDSSGELNVYAADGAQNVAIKGYSRIDVGRGKDDYPNYYKTTAPWGGLGATSLVIGDNITSVGQQAFVGESRITSISGMKDVKSIGFIGFHVMKGVQSLEIPEGLTNVGGQVFQGTPLRELIIPDNLNTNNWSTTMFNGYVGANGSNIEREIIISCQGEMEKCQAAIAKYIPTSKGGTCTSYCLTNATFTPATESQCTGSSYYWSGESCNNRKNGITCANGYIISENKCITCYANGQVEWQGQCLDEYPFAKKRWTPAEASEWLHEGNDNFVIITFKK